MRSYSSKSTQQKTAVPQIKVEFELDDVQFVGDGEMSLLDLSELARLAGEGMESGGPDGVAILADIYRTLLGPDTYKAFRRHCREHKTDGKVLVEILAGTIADESERPTQRPSDSPDGPPPTGTTARVVSLQRGTVQEVETPTEPEPERRVVSYG